MVFFHYPNGKLTQTNISGEEDKWKQAVENKETQKEIYSCASLPLRRSRLPFPALLHCFISQKFRTNRGVLKANEPQVCPSHSLPPSAAVRMKKTTQLRSQWNASISFLKLLSLVNLLIRTSAANGNEFTFFYGNSVLFPNIHIRSLLD